MKKIKVEDWKKEREKKKVKENILEEIGLSHCLIYNKENKYGLLPIRTEIGNYYPKENKYLIGTWTHQELRKAKKEGYEIKKILWSITYKEAKTNPLKNYMEELYKKRQEEQNQFNSYFYKMMMNALPPMIDVLENSTLTGATTFAEIMWFGLVVTWILALIVIPIGYITYSLTREETQLGKGIFGSAFGILYGLFALALFVYTWYMRTALTGVLDYTLLTALFYMGYVAIFLTNILVIPTIAIIRSKN